MGTNKMKYPDRYENVEKYGISAKGRRELLKHLDGGKLSFNGAIIAKCYECMGYYVDGKQDCLIPTCPLYLFFCYREKPRALQQGKPIPKPVPDSLKKYLFKKKEKK